MMSFELVRWAKRTGSTVEWGNMVGPFSGQSQRQTFATEAEAIERERQAKACEALNVAPWPIEVVILHD